jgi:hypothetical protein
MTAADIVRQLTAAGHVLRVDGNALRIRPRAPAELHTGIRALKLEIIAIVNPKPPVEPNDLCGFFIGHSHDPVCRRCGTAWLEHQA